MLYLPLKLSVTEDGLTPETGLGIKFYSEIVTLLTLYLIIDEKKIVVFSVTLPSLGTVCTTLSPKCASKK